MIAQERVVQELESHYSVEILTPIKYDGTRHDILARRQSDGELLHLQAHVAHARVMLHTPGEAEGEYSPSTGL